MSQRAGLIGLQAIGGLSIIPYPFVLLANIMSIAAPRQTLLGAIPYILLSLYPVIWIGIYVLAWRMLSSGSAGVAFALSSVPLLLCLCGAGVFLNSERSVKTFYSKAAGEKKAQVEPLNPLLWTIMCTGGPNRLPGGPQIPAEQAIKAIDANPRLVNVTVPPYGSPLNSALLNLAMNIDGTLGNDRRESAAFQQGLIRVVRALVAHGAQLNGDERVNLWRSWQLKRAMMDPPFDTQTENPLVWRILKRGNGEQIIVRADERVLINKPTRLHGTPLYAALLTNGFYIFPELVNAGARLSAEEKRDPAAAKALAEMLEKYPELRGVYGAR
jgi:hypothetical protein